MPGTKITEQASASVLDCYAKQGTVKIFTKTIRINTCERTELINLTGELRAFVSSTGISDGNLQVSSLHTTAALFVNEWQDALLADIKSLFDRMIPQTDYYKHNDPRLSDCDRKNGDSHLKNAILGHSLSIPIIEGGLVLGQWQNVIMAEFDGPNQRNIFLQVMGI